MTVILTEAASGHHPESSELLPKPLDFYLRQMRDAARVYSEEESYRSLVQINAVSRAAFAAYLDAWIINPSLISTSQRNAMVGGLETCLEAGSKTDGFPSDKAEEQKAIAKDLLRNIGYRLKWTRILHRHDIEEARRAMLYREAILYENIRLGDMK